MQTIRRGAEKEMGLANTAAERLRAEASRQRAVQADHAAELHKRFEEIDTVGEEQAQLFETSMTQSPRESLQTDGHTCKCILICIPPPLAA